MKLVKIPYPTIGMVPMPDSEGLEAFMAFGGEVGILKSIDNTPKWGKLMHVSISRANRFPAWEEILEVKEHFFGDTDAMMVMPKKEDYVNLHPNTFHIWQCPEDWGIQ